MGKANPNHRTRLFYLLLCTLSGIGLVGLFTLLSTASAATPPELRFRDSTIESLDADTHYTPTLQFLTSMGGWYGALELAGSYAYAGNGTELSVVDVTNPSQAHTVKLLHLPGAIYDLQVASGYLYAAAGYGGLLIYDISTPSDPKQLAHLQDEFPVYYVRVSGSLLIAITSRRIQTLDISNPYAPFLLSGYDGYFSPFNPLFIQGDYAYINSMVIDLSDPSSLELAGSFRGTVREVDGKHAVTDDIGCGTHGCDGEYILYDISNPTTPLMLGSQHTSTGVSARFDGNRLYIANSDLWQILDISQPLTPTILSQTWNYSIHGFEVNNDLLYILGNGLEIFDVSDPRNPELIDSYSPMDSTLDYVRSGDVFFLRMLHNHSTHRNLQILDTADPENIVVLGNALQFSGVGSVYDFHRDEDRAILLAYSPFLQIWDFKNASAPVYLGGNQVTNLSVADDLQLTRNRAYLMTGDLKIIDTSDPAQPTLLLAYTGGGNIGWVRALSDNLVYVSSYQWDQSFSGLFVELQIVDFSTAPSYQILGSYDAGYDRFITALEGTPTRAYLGWEDGTVEILDTSVPAIPTLTAVYTSTGVYTSTEKITTLRLSGDLLYAGSIDRLEILDVSDPYSPTLLSRTLISGTVQDITLADGWAYISTGETGLQVYDVSDPTTPDFYRRYPIPTYNVQVIGGLAYLSTQDNGLQVLSLFEPSIYLPYVQINSP